MKILNDPFLEWPFFDEKHRHFAMDLLAFVKTHQKSLEADGVEEKTAVRQLALLLGRGGWLRPLLPEWLGGPRPKVDTRTLCLTRDIIARYSGLADCTFAMQGLAAIPLVLFGTPEQQATYLPGLCDGNLIGAFCLSEAQAGSDVAALQTSAIREQDHYVLNGEKTWISNAGVAHCYIVFARTGEAPGAKGLSAFIVNADTAGFSVPENLTMVAPHVIGRVSFKDCKIPLSARLGGAGDGFKVAMSTLDIMRSTVGAAAVGLARRAMMETLIHTQNRQVFGQNLSAFQSTQMRLADMAIEVDSAALLVYRAAWTKDTLRDRITLEASMAKLQATEAAQRVIDSAVQLFGGLGVTAGSVTERLYREIRPLRIYEGASEIQKLIICAALLK